jgi:DNA-binding SARP family transcriptional activator
MPADPKRVKELFGAAIELNDPAERLSFLERECGDDAELRRQLGRLLQAHERPASALERPLAAPAPAGGGPTGPQVPAAPELTAGGVFAGRYKVRERLGEGGMGSVYVADQTEPVSRRVALKVIKAEVSTAKMLARFEQERQALALMDHPNIAKVLDAGVSGGVPFFVMELIKGVPITRYCDEAKLTPRQRLELFLPVCQAVQHAHQKGIIHRDLKPSNVLVGLYDGRPVPKVIDFGVAKVTGPKLSEHSVYTEVGQIVGTLEYMSPEQAELNNLDLDTRADVYALGVVLYELLTGTVPFPRQELQAAGAAEMLRVIKEVDPPKPSTRVSSSTSLPSIAACRQMEPAKLTRLLRADLDWIVMRALEKDRSRRYETANGLAMDLQRYLADEPVVAGPPGAGYRLRKFVKRNRPQVVAAGLVLLALLFAVVGTTWGLLRARAARDAEAEQRAEAEAQRDKAVAAEKRASEQRQRAEAGEKEAKQQRERAEEEKRVARAVRDFLLTKLLGQADTSAQADALLQRGGFAAAADRNVTVRELLDRAAAELTPEKIEENFPGQPLLQAGILHTVGNTYRGVGEMRLAVAFLQRAAALSRRHLPAGHPDTLTTLHDLAVAYRLAGKLTEAIRLFEQLKEAREKKLGAGHPATLNTLNDLALGHRDAGRVQEAIRLLEHAAEACEKRLGAGHPTTLAMLNNLASAYRDAGKLREAIRLLEQVKQGREKRLGADHPHTLNALNNLAVAYQDGGRAREAIRLLEQVKEAQAKRLGADHPDTLNTLNNLAAVYRAAGKVPEAIQLFERVKDASEKKLGPDHPDTLVTLNNLALAYQAAGKVAEAIRLHEQVKEAREKKLGPDHPHTLSSLNNLAAAHWSAKQLDKSIPLLETALKRAVAKLGRDHPDTLTTMANLGVNYRDAGRLGEALPLLQEANRKGKPHASLAWVEGALVAAYIKAGKTSEAAKLLSDILAGARKSLPADSPLLAGVLAQTGSRLLELKQYAEAEPLLRECLGLREKLLGKRQALPWQVANVKSMLGGALLGQKRHADAEPLLLAGYDGLVKDEKAFPPQARDNLTKALQRLVELYEATGNKDEAARWRKELDGAVRAAKKAGP